MANPNGIDAKLKQVFADLFEVSADRVVDTTRRGEFERWDSLGHLDLMEALRKEFGVTIPLEQALEMETVGDIKRIIGSLVAAK
jgi:acyl carrier protein